MLKEMTWQEFQSWATYESMYPFGWETAQHFAQLMAQQASSAKRIVKPTDVYPFLKNIGTAGRDRVRDADIASEHGMAMISPKILALMGQETDNGSES